MRSVGATVVGTGFIGPVHVEAIRRLGHRVVGVLGSTSAKSRAAANELGIEKGYDSFEELLADAAVEVVHLASPNAAHFDQCKRAIAAGKHVVCEKPLAPTSTETAELVALAAAHPALVTAVNYNVRFYPLCLQARGMVRSGEHGRVFHVTGSYLQDWLLFPADYNWRVEDPSGLRAVADIGSTGSIWSPSSPGWKWKRCALTCAPSTRRAISRPAGARRSRRARVPRPKRWPSARKTTARCWCGSPAALAGASRCRR